MAQPVFFKQPPSLTLAEIAALTKAELLDAGRGGQVVRGIAALDQAGPSHVSFFDNVKYAGQLAVTQAGACFVSERFAARLPSHVAALRTDHPFRAFVTLARALHEDVLRPHAAFGTGIAPSAVIHPSVRLEDDVTVEPLSVIGPRVEIGAGTLVGSGAVIGADVRIGRHCDIGPGTTLHNTLIGNNVLIHPGCHIGQDGYGFIIEGGRHVKVPQAARVIIQNDVEIGAGSTIDRGSLRDTVIGEGTKLDNQVQVGHNVVIGRHCLLAAQIGLAGSLTIGDNVALGAKAGITNHIHIGDGAQLAAMSGVMDDIPAGARYGGAPARPTKQWFRQVLALERLAREGQPGKAPANTKESET